MIQLKQLIKRKLQLTAPSPLLFSKVTKSFIEISELFFNNIHYHPSWTSSQLTATPLRSVTHPLITLLCEEASANSSLCRRHLFASTTDTNKCSEISPKFNQHQSSVISTIDSGRNFLPQLQKLCVSLHCHVLLLTDADIFTFGLRFKHQHPIGNHNITPSPHYRHSTWPHAWVFLMVRFIDFMLQTSRTLKDPKWATPHDLKKGLQNKHLSLCTREQGPAPSTAWHACLAVATGT